MSLRSRPIQRPAEGMKTSNDVPVERLPEGWVALPEAHSQQTRETKAMDDLFESLVGSGAGVEITYGLRPPKHEFLRYLVERRGVLLHGSNHRDIDVLTPALAHCASRNFGNMRAVYAVADEILPIFYAIKDQRRFNGESRSGFRRLVDSSGVERKIYHFAVNPLIAQLKPWSSGMIYVVARAAFEQGTDDQQHPIEEWASRVPVRFLAKLRVEPHDFPFLDDIQADPALVPAARSGILNLRRLRRRWSRWVARL